MMMGARLLLLGLTDVLLAWCAKNCGEITVSGYGSVSVIGADWNVPGERAGNVSVEDGKVVPSTKGRAYFGDACSTTPEVYDPSQYVAWQLLGKRLSYTTNLAGALCGCNAALYLTSLHQSSGISGCKDYYCDANNVCGGRCAEIDLQEANERAWHSTLHVAADGAGASRGYGGGGDGWNGPRDWNKSQYGPKGTCIDTLKPFDVDISFPTGDDGILKSMDVTLMQEGGESALTVRIDTYTFKDKNGLLELTAALKEGMTPIVSYWKFKDMLWLDGRGMDHKGACKRDNTTFDECRGSVEFYNFAIADILPESSPSYLVYYCIAGTVILIGLLGVACALKSRTQASQPGLLE